MKILIVEDEPLSKDVLISILSQRGYQVLTADDGADAWRMLNQEPVRIIISDWLMPKMNGLELCQMVRKTSNIGYTYFILLTSRTGVENHEKAIASGVDDFLTKPAHPSEISNRLHVAERILGFTTQIRHLKSLLPICMYCKKIRDDQNYWQQIESYIHTHAGTDFSHGICPACYKEHVTAELNSMRAGKAPGSHPKT